VNRAPAPRRARDNARSPRHRRRDALTARERRFVAEYVVDLNATQAAIRSGYSRRTAGSIGSENLQKPDIASAIATVLEARAVRTGITQDRVLDELAILAFSDVTHYRVSDAGDVTLAANAPREAMRALQSIKRRIVTRGRGTRAEREVVVEIRLWDKPGPLKLAGQHVGLFTEKVEHSGTLVLEDAVMASRQPSEADGA